MMTFEEGQTVYDRSGRVYQFAGMMGKSAIVHPMLEGEGYDGEPCPYPSELAEAKSVSDIFDNPPIPLINADVALAKQKLKELNDAIAEASAELRNAEKVNAARLEKLKRYDALSRIEDFIDGKMTHFAIRGQYSHDIKVKTFDEVMKCKNDYGRFNGDIKLLSLFGTRKDYPQHGNASNDLLWRVNQYSDGSGSGWWIVHPCMSEDEAITIAAKWLEEIWAEHRGLTDRGARAGWLRGSIESAKSLSLPAPDDIIADFDAYKTQAAQEAVDKARAELEKALAAQGGAA